MIELKCSSSAPEEFSYSLKTREKHSQADYSEFPDLSDSVLSEADKIKFGDLFQSYRDVFAFTDDQLGKTSLVQHVIDHVMHCLLSNGRIEPVLSVNKRLIAK